MATPKEMAKFLEGCPEDTRAVLVVQRHRMPMVFRTEDLELKKEWPDWSNWPKAVWEGIGASLQRMPDPPEDEGEEGEPPQAEAP
jgi:hypothetical protein